MYPSKLFSLIYNFSKLYQIYQFPFDLIIEIHCKEDIDSLPSHAIYLHPNI